GDQPHLTDMTYTISYMQNGRSVADEPWKGSFSDAKRIVEGAVASDEYDRADIRNDRDEIVFARPRNVRPAN
ncbi:MAG: hypothetical protein AAGE86_10575, partial [Pseudomonadota bacterium]